MRTELRRLAAACLALGAAAAEAEPLRTVQPGHLTVAVYRDFAPFAKGEQGIEADLGKALADKLGLVAEVREYREADDVDGDLRNIIWRGHHLWRGRLADVMMHVPVDPHLIEKNDQVRIFGAYYQERLAVVRNRSRIPTLPTLQIFTLEKIGVQAESLEDRYLVTSFGGVLRSNVVHFGSIEDAVDALLKDEVSAVMGCRSLIEGALGGKPGYEVGTAPAPGLSLSSWQLGLAVKADNLELAAALEKAMRELVADGTVERIFARWGVSWLPPPQPTPSTVAPGKETTTGAPAGARGDAAPAAAAISDVAAAAAPAGEAPAPEAIAAVRPVPVPAPRPPASPPTEARGPPASPLGEDIVVTATRAARAQRDVPVAPTVIRRQKIDETPSRTADDLLRTVPSFNLFRRSSSVGADPSSQGVALRGIGPSGVSRSLVLVDGVPANDPFGGWVYWRALPMIGIDRIEVVPGGGSALYGNYAMGGVTQIFTSPITARDSRGFAEAGSFDQVNAGLRASDRYGPLGVAVEAQGLTTHGYPVVAPSQRGPIDGSAPSTDAVVNARAEAAPAEDLTVRARAGYFYEDWNGGTHWTTAGVKQLAYGTSARYAPSALGALDLSLFGQVATFTQSRGRANAARTTEVQSGWQTVPAHDLGASAVWTSRRLELGGTHTLTAGADGRRITGTTHEDLYPATLTPASVVHRDSGGTQWLYGVFGQEVYDVSALLSLHAALRYDGWTNADGLRQERTSAGGVTLQSFAKRTDGQLSPKLGVVLRAAPWFTLRASGYQAFRAPTLSELYRPFQVGTTLTAPNDALAPEKLTGAEAGMDVAPLSGLTTRVTGFWTELKDPITSVTQSTSPGLTLRQRQNLGAARIEGVEASAAQRIARAWLVSLGYTFAYSQVTSAPGQPQLVGKDLPQDPRHRVVASVSYDDPRVVTAAVQARYISTQYEDDVNTLRMKEFVLVDLSVARRVTRTVDVVLAVENLFDKQYTVGLSGVETIGAPRFIHGGVRFNLDR